MDIKQKIKDINLAFKKYKFFNIFIAIGFISIIVELFIFNLLNYIEVDINVSSISSLIIGVLFAFYFNFFFNFEIHKSKIKKAFLFFLSICFFSWSFQKIVSNYFIIDYFSYEATRLITSAIFFLIGYVLHRKFSFKDFKKVGIAIYLDRNVNLKKIFRIIGNNSDFIHLDIVDQSFSKSAVRNDFTMLRQIKNLWPTHEIQTHIMSKRPKKLIEELIEYSDIIFIHWEIKENLDDLRKLIISHNKKFGIAVTLNTPPKKIINLLKKSSALLILSVDDPGFSGQKFNFNTFDYIEFFNKLNFRDKFRICVDGGVDKNIVKILDVDDIVSNSSILGSKDPINEIMKFQSNNS
jgi:pentose-5-phosphate-3-epimerase/putative flippase GtrA